MSYAFWSINQPPWIIGDHVLARMGDRILTDNFGVKVPMYVTDDEAGLQIIIYLMDIGSRYQRAIDDIRQSFISEAYALIPEESLPQYYENLQGIQEIGPQKA